MSDSMSEPLRSICFALEADGEFAAAFTGGVLYGRAGKNDKLPYLVVSDYTFGEPEEDTEGGELDEVELQFDVYTVGLMRCVELATILRRKLRQPVPVPGGTIVRLKQIGGAVGEDPDPTPEGEIVHRVRTNYRVHYATLTE